MAEQDGLDSESGLVYLQARYYDPTTGQWSTRDPLVAQTRSAYGYVYDSPLNNTDASGLGPAGAGPQEAQNPPSPPRNNQGANSCPSAESSPLFPKKLPPGYTDWETGVRERTTGGWWVQYECLSNDGKHHIYITIFEEDAPDSSPGPDSEGFHIPSIPAPSPTAVATGGAIAVLGSAAAFVAANPEVLLVFAL